MGGVVCPAPSNTCVAVSNAMEGSNGPLVWPAGHSMKVAVTGAAGLIGQNLIVRLKARGYANIVALDKHKANVAILRRLHPDITIIESDLSRDDGWQAAVADADVVVLSHAQIGGLVEAEFTANNVTATARVIAAVRAKAPYVVHISVRRSSNSAGERLVRPDQGRAGEASSSRRAFPTSCCGRP